MIRFAAPGDAEAVGAIHVDGWRAAYRVDGRTKTASFGETRLIELRMKKGAASPRPLEA